MATPDQSRDEPRQRTRPRFRRIAAAILAVYWIGMFVGTHIPLPKNAFPPGVSDKSLHFLAYAGLAFLLGFWRSRAQPWSRGEFATLLAIVAGYGILDELLQIPVNRHADVRDWLADLTGAAAGFSVFTVAIWFLRLRQPTLDTTDVSRR